MVFFVPALFNIYRAVSLFAHEQTAHSRGPSSGPRHWPPSPDHTLPIGISLPGHTEEQKGTSSKSSLNEVLTGTYQ